MIRGACLAQQDVNVTGAQRLLEHVADRIREPQLLLLLATRARVDGHRGEPIAKLAIGLAYGHIDPFAGLRKPAVLPGVYDLVDDPFYLSPESVLELHTDRRHVYAHDRH